MKRKDWTLIVLGVLALVMMGTPVWAFEGSAAEEMAVGGSDTPALSPYWHPRVQQWADVIAQEATRRNLDADFLASVVWMESRGRPDAVGPVGAVGLMQVMPREVGFSWRPTKAELMDPQTNLFWGARTLATVVEQSEGDIFNALAAYNGGWHQIQYRGPQHFATTILRDYAKAIARRHDLLWSEPWLAIFAVNGPRIEGPIWIADSARDDVYFFSNDNWIPEGSLLIPESVPPTAVLASFEDKAGMTRSVGVWFYRKRQDMWLEP